MPKTIMSRKPMPIPKSASFQESSLPNSHIKRGYPKGKISIEGQIALSTLFCSLSIFTSFVY